MYDQLNVLSPIMLALTAGTPFYKGKISDWDVRWKIISDSVDDRTPDERNPNSPHYIPTSRYN
jgi:glutamate--cysteine ligase catalytic subunit